MSTARLRGQHDGSPATPPPPPPPPPPDVYTLRAAERADRDAWEVLQAMDADLPAYGDLVMAAWDRAHLAGREYAQLRTAYEAACKWQTIGALL